MEDVKGYIELIIAATYSAHTIIAFRETGDRNASHGEHQTPHAPADEPIRDPNPVRHNRFHFSPEVLCLLAVTLSYYTMAGVSVLAGH
jgi:hypothetical protein